MSVLDYHTEGHPARIVMSGVANVPGRSMAERSAYFAEHMDHIRQFILFEPRGSSFMVAMLLTPALRPEADMGMLILEIPGMAPMCGHGTIAAVTAMIETGIVQEQPITNIVLDTPAGLVRTRARVTDGRVQEVSVENVPAYPLLVGGTINASPYGKLEIDVAYGGDYYAIVAAERVGLELVPSEKNRIVNVANELRRAIADQLMLVDPVAHRQVQVTSIQFWTRSTTPGVTFRNTVAFPPDQVDRSPCGTGTCARMATLFSRGELKIGQPFIHESIIGTLFRGVLTEETRCGDVAAVVPCFSGRAYIMAIQQLMLDASDPFPRGYLLAR